mmetsp:Transcript_14343/g.33929  ORF Transcript_14343/g.33929 Transcript_14343/m.33929 type:complete len:307 (-) Transcript_14343:885-1805(-)
MKRGPALPVPAGRARAPANQRLELCQVAVAAGLEGRGVVAAGLGHGLGDQGAGPVFGPGLFGVHHLRARFERGESACVEGAKVLGSAAYSREEEVGQRRVALDPGAVERRVALGVHVTKRVADGGRLVKKFGQFFFLVGTEVVKGLKKLEDVPLGLPLGQLRRSLGALRRSERLDLQGERGLLLRGPGRHLEFRALAVEPKVHKVGPLRGQARNLENVPGVRGPHHRLAAVGHLNELRFSCDAHVEGSLALGLGVGRRLVIRWREGELEDVALVEIAAEVPALRVHNHDPIDQPHAPRLLLATRSG